MTEKNRLIYLFENMEKGLLIKDIYQFSQASSPIPLDDLFTIFEETMDIELIMGIMECFLHHIDDVGEQIMSKYKQASNVVKQHIIVMFSRSARSKYMLFLLEEYFYNPYMRPFIRRHAFKDKRFLFMNLVRYFEDAPFNEDNVLIAQQILGTIPRDVVLSCLGVFNGTKLLDVYYAMPVEDREKFDT